MQLQGQQLIPASVERTWAALNDPEVLKACVPGCETLERTADDAFSATMALKIGPVSARFKGNLKLTDVQAPTSYTIHFDGQGGVAGFGKGSAAVRLEAADGGTLLHYDAKAQVGGKLAQIGSRMVDAAAGKITQDFFRAFCEKVGAEAVAAGEVPPSAEAGALDASANASAEGAAVAAAPARPATASVTAPSRPATSGTGVPAWAWFIAGVVVGVLLSNLLG